MYPKYPTINLNDPDAIVKVFNQVIDECFEDNTEEEAMRLVGKWERQANRTVRHTARRCRQEITVTTDQSIQVIRSINNGSINGNELC